MSEKPVIEKEARKKTDEISSISFIGRRNFIEKTIKIAFSALIADGIIAATAKAASVKSKKISIKPVKIKKAYIEEINGKKVIWITGTPTEEQKLLIPKLRLPLIAQDGAMVPLAMEVKLPMTAKKYLKTFYVCNLNNPKHLLGSFALPPANGKGYISPRIKLLQQSSVQVLAEFSDGTVYGGRELVKVTVGGC